MNTFEHVGRVAACVIRGGGRCLMSPITRGQSHVNIQIENIKFTQTTYAVGNNLNLMKQTTQP